MALLVVALVGRMEVLAAQAPGSPFHAGVLPGPVAQLRAVAFDLALAVGLGALLLPRIYPEGEPRGLAVAVAVGSALLLLASGYCAAVGMYGAQLDDPRPDAMLSSIARVGGGCVLGGCALVGARRAMRRFSQG